VRPKLERLAVRQDTLVQSVMQKMHFVVPDREVEIQHVRFGEAMYAT
jgi:hypothetical protein